MKKGSLTKRHENLDSLYFPELNIRNNSDNRTVTDVRMLFPILRPFDDTSFLRPAVNSRRNQDTYNQDNRKYRQMTSPGKGICHMIPVHALKYRITDTVSYTHLDVYKRQVSNT